VEVCQFMRGADDRLEYIIICNVSGIQCYGDNACVTQSYEGA